MAKRKRPAPRGGLSSSLQRSFTTPGGTPGASMGSIGTGGGSTARKATGNVKKRDRTGKT